MTDETPWPEPRKNPELIGHEAAECAFADSLRSGRLPHAWLMCGPEGIGKATLAFRFARFLLAGGTAPGLFGADNLDMDAEHPVFRRVAAGGHADLMTVEISPDPKTGKMRTEIVVDDVRSVNEFLHMTPAEGGYRVVVVDAVDRMNRNAANALLKILEEPPSQAVLLLVCHAPGRVVATIRSRCRKLVLRPLADAEVGQLLSRFLPELEDRDRAALVKLAEGSPGRALALAQAGGLELYREMVDVIAAAGSPGAALQKFCERSARAEEGFRTVTQLFLWWLARAIRLSARGGDFAGDEIVAGEGAALARVARAGGLDRFVELWEKAGRLFARAESVNLDRKQVVMSAFVALENAAAP
ncbi:MAG TPA: DNA polymerase III subunit delta' [Alphaproteobacteria bacterium]|jgi:DNA polymerase-3 subunit delta'|nr:DNA polymerase III subunit delta' [Alphaproteobacteria bacterium]